MLTHVVVQRAIVDGRGEAAACIAKARVWDCRNWTRDLAFTSWRSRLRGPDISNALRLRDLLALGRRLCVAHCDHHPLLPATKHRGRNEAEIASMRDLHSSRFDRLSQDKQGINKSEGKHLNGSAPGSLQTVAARRAWICRVSPGWKLQETQREWRMRAGKRDGQLPFPPKLRIRCHR